MLQLLLDKDLTAIHHARKHYHVYDEIIDSMDLLLDTELVKNPYANLSNPNWATQDWIGWVWLFVRETGKGPAY